MVYLAGGFGQVKMHVLLKPDDVKKVCKWGAGSPVEQMLAGAGCFDCLQWRSSENL